MVRRFFGRGGDDSDKPSGPSRHVLDPPGAPPPPRAQAREKSVWHPEGPEPGSRGMILVRHPDGDESRLPVAMKPVTIGSWEQCDIALSDQLIRPVHIRVSPLADGEFRIHGLAAPALRPFDTNVGRPDEFMLVRSGDEVRLPGEDGEYVIHFLSSQAAANFDALGRIGDEAPPAAPSSTPSEPVEQADTSAAGAK